jgi:hypothetical protein
MIYIIAGDAATQLPKVQATGIGEVVQYVF